MIIHGAFIGAYKSFVPQQQKNNVYNVDIGLKECKKIEYIVDKWQEKRSEKPTELLQVLS